MYAVSFREISSDECGGTAIEYVLIASLIAIVMIGGMKNMQTAIFATMEMIVQSVGG